MFFFSQTNHELVRDGASQMERSVAALSPDYVKVDERNTEELLNFIYQYARQINYYQGNPDQRKGDWTAFFDNSVPFQIALIAKYEDEEILSQFEALKKLTETTLKFSDLTALFDLVYSLAETLDQWYKGLQGDQSGVRQNIANLIETNLSFSLKKLLGFSNAARAWGYQFAFDLDDLETFWGVNISENMTVRYAVDQTLINKKGSQKAKIAFALAAVEELFLVFHKGLSAIVEIAKRADTVELSISKASDHSPHIGLLFAFLRLFKRLQGDLNRITNEHLEFFYKKVLQLETREAVPDKAHLVFALAQQLEDHKIAKGTLFKAGEDENGEEVVFELEEEIIVNKAKVESLKTLYIDQEKVSPGASFPVVKNVYYAPDATKADGIKEKFSSKVVSSWETLGSNLSKFKETPESDLRPYPFARLGFIIASKVLLLREGRRTVDVFINCDKPLPEAIDIEGNEVFKIKLSGEEGWFYPQEQESSIAIARKADYDKVLHIKIVLQSTEPPVFYPGAEFFETDYGHALPMMALELNHESAKRDEEKIFSLYHDLRCCKIIGASIEVTVCGIRNLLIQDDDGLLDASKPFLPFGPAPRAGSSNFLLSSEEAFCKSWTDVHVRLQWKDKPDFLKYYEAYPGYRDGAGLQEDGFRVKIAYLLDNDWKEKSDVSQLFNNDGASTRLENCSSLEGTIFNLSSTDFIGSEEDPACDHFLNLLEDIDEIPQCGFLRFTLTGEDFQHLEYPNVLTVQLVALGRYPDIITNAVYRKSDGSLRVFTNELISEINDTHEAAFKASLADKEVKNGGYLDGDNQFKRGLDWVRSEAYESEIEKDQLQAKILETQQLLTDAINKGDIAHNLAHDLIGKIIDKEVVIPNPPYTPEIETISLDYKAKATLQQTKIIHLFPDEATYLPLQDKEDRLIDKRSYLLPQFIDEGALYIGLQDLEPGANLNLLFQIAESTADPEVDKAKICWHYLRNNEWKTLKKDFHILSDETDGFIRPGIVQFSIPTDISNKETTILPGNLHWLKASAALRTAAVGETVVVHAQAAKAVYRPGEVNSPNRLSDPLPAGTIGKFLEGNAAIGEVLQPFAGFGGKRAETPATFYTRISEHLRHKGRAITLYDYERLILEEFPEIFKVKCITHTFGRRGRDTQDIELAPGYVTIVVIPDLRKFEVADPYEPKASLSLLNKIKDFLRDKTSPFVELKVLNPRYERISIGADIQFQPGKSVDFYSEQLVQDIRRFLAPWAFGETELNISFGGKIFKSTILKFVEDRDYIDYAVNFIMKDEQGRVLDPIIAQTARSILVSADAGMHSIKPCTEESCLPENPRLANMIGIGYDKI